MVWTLRTVCYFSNFLFLEPAENVFLNFLRSSLVFNIAILSYGIVCLAVIEKLAQKHFNPKYEDPALPEEQFRYRVENERLLLSSFSFSAINFLLGILFAVSVGKQEIESPALGLFAVVGSLFAVFFGIVFLVGRFGETGKRKPHLYPIGIAAFLLPTIFILYMGKTIFID